MFFTNDAAGDASVVVRNQAQHLIGHAVVNCAAFIPASVPGTLATEPFTRLPIQS